jgi:dihydropteroate synthase
MFQPFEWKAGNLTLTNAERTLVMGILNATPDSFSDGGSLADSGAAVERGLAMWEAGAEIIDIGGESTRPGADIVPLEEELLRVIPVVGRLVDQGVTVSIDTIKPSVAAAAVEAGAVIINDVSGFRSDRMTRVAAETGAGVVIMHMLGRPKDMQEAPTYDDVVLDVETFLREMAEAVEMGGVQRERIAVDPGIGFGKTHVHNVALLGATPTFANMGYPVVIGISRKRFLGTFSGIEQPHDRDQVSAVLGAHIAATGAGVLRVHNVAATRSALSVVDPLIRTVSGI